MTPLIVGMDLDDVLADFIKSFMNIAHRKYGVDESLRPTSWEWDDIGITKTQINGTWETISQTENFWERLDTIRGVDPELIYELDVETKLYFPTARAACAGEDVGLQSARWLNRKFGIPFPTVIVSTEKGEMAKALKYDYFIDDRPKNCVDIKKVLPNCKVYLSEATHNQSFDNVAAGIPRISNANEFARLVLAEARKQNEEVAA